jgi:hypothetical protein
LRADGTFAAPTASATPAGADTEIQFNNAGAFGASASFTYNNSTEQLSISDITSKPTTLNPNAFLSVSGFSSTTGTGGGFLARAGSSTVSGGGQFLFEAGQGATSGGFTEIKGGRSLGGTGGSLLLTSGLGSVNSGAASLLSANSTTGNSGACTLGSGTSSFSTGSTGAINVRSGNATGATGNSGNITINCGTATNNGGTLVLRGGTGVTTRGAVNIQSPSSAVVIRVTDSGSVGPVSQLGFFAVTPVAKQTTAAASAAYAAGPTVGVFHEDDTYGGYTIGQIVTALKAYGLLT